jgi:eukaryotic-like serine/threonine-protein kinase
MLLITPMLALSSMAQRSELFRKDIDAPDSQWAMFRHDLTHSGHTNSLTPNNNDIAWQSQVAIGHIADSPAAVAGGKVYIGTWQNPYIWPYGEDGHLYCFDINNGKELWRFETSGWIVSSPAIDNGRVYFGSKNTYIYSLDANNGRQIWSYKTNGYIRSSPAVMNGKVYVGSMDNYIYCLDAQDGSLLWKYKTQGPVVSSPAIANDHVYVGSWDGTLYCIHAESGNLIWSYLTSSDYQITSSPSITDQKVYFGTDQRTLFHQDGAFYCLDAKTGDEIWFKRLNSNIYSSPAIAYGQIFIGTSNRFLSLDAETGDELWEYTYPNGYGSSSPAVANGKVIVTMNLRVPGTLYVGGVVLCLNAFTGESIWNYGTRAQMSWSSPAIARGMVFVGNGANTIQSAGTVYAIGNSK